MSTVIDTIKNLFIADPSLLTKAIRHSTLSESFVVEFADIINWSDLLEWQQFQEPFIRKFIHKVDLDTAFNRQRLSEQFIEEYARPNDWKTISARQVLSELFIIKHKKKVAWLSIITFQNLSEQFIRHHIVGKYDIYYLPHASRLSEEFIDEFTDELSWDHISRRQPLMIYSYEFINRHSERLEWWAVLQRRDLPWSFIRKFKHKFKQYPKTLMPAIRRQHQRATFELTGKLSHDVVSIIFAFI